MLSALHVCISCRLVQVARRSTAPIRRRSDFVSSVVYSTREQLARLAHSSNRMHFFYLLVLCAPRASACRVWSVRQRRRCGDSDASVRDRRPRGPTDSTAWRVDERHDTGTTIARLPSSLGSSPHLP